MTTTCVSCGGTHTEWAHAFVDRRKCAGCGLQWQKPTDREGKLDEDFERCARCSGLELRERMARHVCAPVAGPQQSSSIADAAMWA